jgi:hypothetical protein
MPCPIIIESAFAKIRHRTKRSKGWLSRDGMLHTPLVTLLRNALPGSVCSSWGNVLNKTGGSYAALTALPKSSQASRSKTELQPQTTARSPHDRQTSNTRSDNNSYSKNAYANRSAGSHMSFNIYSEASHETMKAEWARTPHMLQRWMGLAQLSTYE